MPENISVSASIDSEKLSFLDGYLFRIMVHILKSEGAEASGLYDYYRARIEQEGSALSPYDRMLYDFVRRRFAPHDRRILHAGTGLGTLPSALATAGFAVAGVEQDGSRFRAAARVRAALAEAWPDVADRYQLIHGEYPSVVTGSGWLAPETVLIFTNCGATWGEGLFARVLASLPVYGDVVLDARLFGEVRNTPEERRSLLKLIEAQGLAIDPIEESPAGAFYYHLKPKSGLR